MVIGASSYTNILYSIGRHQSKRLFLNDSDILSAPHTAPSIFPVVLQSILDRFLTAMAAIGPVSCENVCREQCEPIVATTCLGTGNCNN